MITKIWKKYEEKLLPYFNDVFSRLGSKYSKNKSIKARNDIKERFISKIIKIIPFDDLDEFIKDYKDNNIFDPICYTINGSNLLKYVKKDKYIDFVKELFEVRSFGIGTPNAASGEGEFLAAMLSSLVVLSKTKDGGDLIFNNKKIEIKSGDLGGAGTRVYANCTGNAFLKGTMSLAKKYGYCPNNCNNGRKAVEFYKQDNNTKNHWTDQFKNNIVKASEFIHECMIIANINIPKDIIENKCFDANIFNSENFLKEMIKHMWKTGNRYWDYFTYINPITYDIRVIDNNHETFFKYINNGTIVIGNNYFRVFQDFKLGWYINFA